MSVTLKASVAVIGCGYWGRNLTRNFFEAGVLRVVCDASEAARLFVGEAYPEVRFEAELEAVLADESINAVAIATPAVTHAEIALAALRAGKDVFVEKPLALDPEDGERVVAEAERLGRILFVGHLLWYHPAVLKLKAIISEGGLGKIRYITSQRLNFGKLRNEENVLWSFAPHDISVIIGLLGEEPSVRSCSGGYHLSDEVADVTSTELRFPSGASAHLFVSWLHPFKEQKLVVVGEEKMAVFDDVKADEKLMIFDHAVEWEAGTPVAVKGSGKAVWLEASEPLRNEVDRFISCVETRERPLTDGREGLRVLRVLSACQAALNRKGGGDG